MLMEELMGVSVLHGAMIRESAARSLAPVKTTCAGDFSATYKLTEDGSINSANFNYGGSD